MSYEGVDSQESRIANPIQRKYLSKCIQLAMRSNVKHHKHGCVIVDRRTGEIVSSGFNIFCKSSIHESIHAEVAAIRNASKRFLQDHNCEMYVVRVRNNFKCPELKYSKPCPNCQGFIHRRTRIRKIFYSTSGVSYKSDT
jgi:tRNA(Arg) A34 adenosine deaminase TadA